MTMAKKKAVKPTAKAKPVRLPKQIDGLAHVREQTPPTIIDVGGRIMERPNPNKIDALLHEELAKALHPFQVVRLYRSLFVARRVYFDRHGKRHSTPDNAIRLGALKDYMDRVQGRPIERQMLLKAEAPATMDDLIAEAERSPAFAESLLAVVQRIVNKGK